MDSQIINIRDISREIEAELEDDEININLFIVKRNGKKCHTMIEGLEQIERLDIKTVTKYFKEMLGCGATFLYDNRLTVVQLQGDHRKFVKNFLVSEKLVNKEHVHIRGY